MTFRRAVVINILVPVAACAAAGAADKGPVTVDAVAVAVVEAGKTERIDTPVSFEVGDLAKHRKLGLVEITANGVVYVPSQIEKAPDGKPLRLWWILGGTTPAGATRNFAVLPVDPMHVVRTQAPPRSAFQMRESGRELEISGAGAKVLTYNHAPAAVPEGVQDIYSRSGFIHPVCSPGGGVVTDVFPPDHLHQDGVFLAWTKTTFRGRKIDFWNIHKGTGRVRTEKLLSDTTGPVYAGFRVAHEHVDVTDSQGAKPQAGTVVLRETWDVRIWNVGGPAQGYWLWEITSVQRCATDDPLVLPKHFYGGMGFRGARGWDGEKVQFLTSEGKTRKDGNETRARWCDASGPVATTHRFAGATVLCHPSNFRAPQHVRLHPKMPYFCFCPSQLGDWRIEPGKEYVSRYRYYVHDGKVKAATAERFWADFATPPKVVIKTGISD